MTAPRLDGATILVVEDEALIGVEIVFVLEEAGATVIGPATTLAAALDVINKQQLDAAVLDVRLGTEESGMAAQALVERGVPFAFHTGHGDGVMLSSWPGRPILRKPVPPEEVATALAALVKRKAVT